MPSHGIYTQNCYSKSSASLENGGTDIEESTPEEAARASHSSSATEGQSIINDEAHRSQDNVVECSKQLFHGIAESEQPMAVEVAVTGDRNNFRSILAISTLLEHSYIVAAAVIRLGLQRIPLPPPLKAVCYYTPFGLLAPTHFVTMTIRGTEPGNPCFKANVAVLDMAIDWQGVSIFIGEGLRSKAMAAIVEARHLRRLASVGLPLPRTIADIEVDEHSANVHPEIEHDGATLDQSSPNLYYVGPRDTNRLCPPTPATAPSRSISRIDAAGSPDTPLRTRVSSEPTSFELDALSRCSREAQGDRGMECLSHDGHGATCHKVHLTSGIDCSSSIKEMNRS
ncbi:hypothetical protein CLIM01_14838 [Colletotrichum limetticola]|uniref:Uncharacterized protein n=1 Tax=Colletotrichum limetticola TaxID=1209924 RepID=A0ABQ9P7D4_9PEZI|nr:hypothetical protein CLIM01_14838 [Colletotrichum limetticola]